MGATVVDGAIMGAVVVGLFIIPVVGVGLAGVDEEQAVMMAPQAMAAARARSRFMHPR